VSLAVALAGAAAVAEPDHDVEIQVSRTGFHPAQVTLRRGETVRVVVVTKEAETHCFAVDALRVEKLVAPGRPARVELTLHEAGRLTFHCCLETGDAAQVERGELVVSE
jgi:plastocyanin